MNDVFLGAILVGCGLDLGRGAQADFLPGETATDGPCIDVNVNGRSTLTLKVTNGGNGNKNDLAVWADARLLTETMTTRGMAKAQAVVGGKAGAVRGTLTMMALAAIEKSDEARPRPFRPRPARAWAARLP